MTKDIPIKITVETSDVTRAARKSERAMDKIDRKAKKTGGSIGKSLSTGFSSFAKTAGLVTGAVAIGAALAAVGKNILDINRKFESLTMQLKTFLGDGEKAKQMFKAIQQFAAPLPMTVEETTQAVIKMMSLGLRPTEAALTSFGNIAAGTNKTIMQFTEAVADAVVGEYERLKEFGIKARVEGNKVAMTFGGVTTLIGRDAASMQAYLEELGRTKFGGAMADQSNTVNGALSILKSSWDNLAYTLLNDDSMDFIAKSINWVAGVLDDLTDGVKQAGFIWDSIWLNAEKVFLEFYSTIAPLVDKYLQITGQSSKYAMSEVEYVNKRLSELTGEIAANSEAWDQAIESEKKRKKIDDFTKATNNAGKAVEDAGEAAKKAAAKQRALDMVMQLLHPDTAKFVQQEREVNKAFKEGLITEKQKIAALEKIAELRAEAAAEQGKADQEMVLGIIDPGLQAYTEQMKALDEATKRGTITWDQYTAAVNKLKEARAEEALASSTKWIDGAKRGLQGLVKDYEDSATAIENIITDAFKGAEDALVEFCKTGKLDFTSLADTILDQMLRIAIQQQIMAPFAKWMSGAASGSETGSGLGGMVSGIASLFGFASGGSFKVSKATSIADSKGTDNRIVAFRARDGENVSVSRNGTAGSGNGMTMNVYAKDADSFRRSESQILARGSALMNRAAMRNN